MVADGADVLFVQVSGDIIGLRLGGAVHYYRGRVSQSALLQQLQQLFLGVDSSFACTHTCMRAGSTTTAESITGDVTLTSRSCGFVHGNVAAAWHVFSPAALMLT